MLLWLKRYWYIPFLVVGGFAVYILFGRWRPGSGAKPFEGVQRELDAINAGAEAAKVKAELSHEQALQHIDEKYQDRVAKMDLEQKAQAEKLRNDPEALARYIIRGTS